MGKKFRGAIDTLQSPGGHGVTEGWYQKIWRGGGGGGDGYHLYGGWGGRSGLEWTRIGVEAKGFGHCNADDGCGNGDVELRPSLPFGVRRSRYLHGEILCGFAGTTAPRLDSLNEPSSMFTTVTRDAWHALVDVWRLPD